MKKRLPRQRNGKLHLHNDNIGTTNKEYDMSELKIVRGNTFAIKIEVKAYNIDGTELQDFDLHYCTDIEVSARRNMYSLNDMPYELLDGNYMKVVFLADQQRTGCYNLEVKGKIGDVDWRFYDLRVFYIVESNDEAEIPQSSIIDDDYYLIEGAYLSIPVAKGDDGQGLESVTVNVVENDPPLPSPTCQYTYQDGNLDLTFFDLKGEKGDSGGGSSTDINEYVDNTVVVNMDTYNLSACSLGTNKKWYNVGNAMFHRAVPVQEGDVFKLTPQNDPNGAGVIWGLVTSSYTGNYSNGNTIPFISDEDRHFALEGETTTITIPSGCAYLIVCDKDGSGQKYYTLRKVVEDPIDGDKLVLESKFDSVANRIGVGDKIRVCAWNIGCFHNGGGGTSSIPRANYVDYSMTWKNILNNINADCLCLSEFNPNFVEASGNDPAISSRTEIFGNYPYDSIGAKNGQLCEAIISNRVLSNCNFVPFSKGGRYYAVTTIHIGEIPVRLASIHLDYQQNSDGLTKRTAQIADLVRDLSAMGHVIICGDTNVASMSELDPLTNAGFSLVNGGHLGQLTTYDNDPEAEVQYLPCIDNIIVKGFAINDVRVYGIKKSDVFPDADPDYTIADHHAIAATLTLL